MLQLLLLRIKHHHTDSNWSTAQCPLFDLGLRDIIQEETSLSLHINQFQRLGCNHPNPSLPEKTIIDHSHLVM